MQSGRMQRRVRPILLMALALSAIWAAWWLWPARKPSIDFRFEMHPTGQMVLHDLIADAPLELPFYKGDRFYSAKGDRIAARDVLRYHPGVPGSLDPSYTAMFRMAPDTTRADFTRAVHNIWSLCGANVVAAPHGEEETFLILPEPGTRDCMETCGVPEADGDPKRRSDS